jgi:hypothetical protein
VKLHSWNTFGKAPFHQIGAFLTSVFGFWIIREQTNSLLRADHNLLSSARDQGLAKCKQHLKFMSHSHEHCPLIGGDDLKMKN